MTDDADRKQQELAHYSASVNAWFTTRLELDKSLLVLSSAAIGLLLTLIQVFGIHSAEGLVLHMGALAAFVFCICAVLAILGRNSIHLEDTVRKGAINDQWLALLDRAAIVSFFFGVVFTLVIGVGGAISSYQTWEKDMSTDKSLRTLAHDSFNRVSAMKPEVPDALIKSFNGAANMKPQADTQTAGTSAVSAPQSQPAQGPAVNPSPTQTSE